MKLSEQLHAAADLIQTYGWGVGGETWDPAAGEGICLEGAIAAAGGVRLTGGAPLDVDLRECPLYRAVDTYLQDDEQWEESARYRLYRWNDSVATSGEQVIEVLRACALIEEARENAVVKTEVAA